MILGLGAELVGGHGGSGGADCGGYGNGRGGNDRRDTNYQLVIVTSFGRVRGLMETGCGS